MSDCITVRPKPSDFDNFLPWVCSEYNIDADIIINRVLQKPYMNIIAKDGKLLPQNELNKKLNQQRKKSVKVPFLVPSFSDSDTVDSSTSDETPVISNVTKVMIETIYDIDDNLVALKFLKNKTIPRKVMQLVALTLPYQKHLTSITINRGLCMDTLYEISKLLPNSQITELCFDDTFLDKANYHILLTQNKLKHLSLARCMINDDVVKMITDQLKGPCPAAKVLSALNLSNNKITDTGAKFIADMLRSNRQLCYLNLAGNMITDEGGVSILESLQKFEMQSQELIQSRVRYVAHLKERNALIKKFIKELQNAAADKNATKKKPIRKYKLAANLSINYSDSAFETQIIQEKAEFMADKKLGVYNETFSPDNTELQDGVVYCLGNNTLCCLNLAYNNLSYLSLKKLLEVLKMQKHLNRIPRGLIKVIIEGNLMPIACEEFEKIDHLLESGTKIIRAKSESVLKKKHLPVKQNRPGK